MQFTRAGHDTQLLNTPTRSIRRRAPSELFSCAPQQVQGEEQLTIYEYAKAEEAGPERPRESSLAPLAVTMVVLSNTHCCEKTFYDLTFGENSL